MKQSDLDALNWRYTPLKHRWPLLVGQEIRVFIFLEDESWRIVIWIPGQHPVLSWLPSFDSAQYWAASWLSWLRQLAEFEGRLQ